jgi:hypothetical protein
VVICFHLASVAANTFGAAPLTVYAPNNVMLLKRLLQLVALVGKTDVE